MAAAAQPTRPRRLGRYTLHGKIAAGGMATVHIGRLAGEGGFSRIVAIKRMGSHLAEDPEFRAMFLDEARLASRIGHPNVIATIDVGSSEEGLYLVMDYVAGESLASLLRIHEGRAARIDPRIAARIMVDTLNGLHAAHVATDEAGRPLHIVHRDVSPQNVLVGTDGLARVLDFGIAKAAGSNHTTREGQLKGKFRYMAPEQIRDEAVTPRTDVYAASVVLWESLTGQHLFDKSNDAAIVARVLEGVILAPSKIVPTLSRELDAVVLRGLARDPEARFPSALAMAEALEAVAPLAGARQVGQWVEEVAGDVLRRRREQIAAIDLGTEEEVDDAPLEVHAPTTGTLEGAGELGTATLPLEFARASRPGASRRRWMLGAAGAALAAGATVLAFAFEGREGAPRSPFEPRAAPTSPAPSTSTVAAPEPSASSAAEDASSPGVQPSSSAPPPGSTSPAQAPPPPTTSTRRGKSPPTKPSCSPPYYEDSTGIRHAKPECL